MYRLRKPIAIQVTVYFKNWTLWFLSTHNLWPAKKFAASKYCELSSWELSLQKLFETMGHHHVEEKGQTFLYEGGTGAFTAVWMILVFAFLFFLIYLG